MLVGSVPAPTGPKPVKLGLFCQCDVCGWEVDCVLNGCCSGLLVGSSCGCLGCLLSCDVTDDGDGPLCDACLSREMNFRFAGHRTFQLIMCFSNE